MRTLLAGVLVAVLPLWLERPQTPAPPAPLDPAVVALLAATTDDRREAVLTQFPKLAEQPLRTALAAEAARLVRAGDFADGDRAYLAIGWLAERLKEARLRTTSLIGRANVAGQTGDLTSAEAFLREAIALLEPTGDIPALQPAYNNLGIVQRRLGDLDGALASFGRALHMAESAKRVDSVSRTLNNIGLVQFNLGNHRLAHDYFTRSVALKVDDGGVGTQDIANSLANIAGLYLEQGDYRQALEYNQRALALWERVGGAGMSSVQSNLGQVHAATNQPAVALDYFNRAMALAKAQNERPKVATLYYHLANLSFEAGRLDEAEATHRKGLAIREEIGDRVGTVESMTNLAMTMTARGLPAEALPIAARARELAAETRLLNQLWKAELAVGVIQQVLKRRDEAARAYEASLWTIERLRDLSSGGERQRQLYFSDRMEPYYRLAALHLEAGREAEAFRVVEQARARGLLDLLAGGRPVVQSLTASEHAREKQLTQALVSMSAQIQSELSRRQPSRDRLTALDAELARARLARDAFITDIYSAHPDLQFRRGEAPIVTLAGTASLLRPGIAIVEFLVEPDRVSAFVLRARRGAPQIAAVRLPVVAADLKRDSVAFSRQVAARDLGFGKRASALYTSVLGSLERHLDGITHVVFVPDGPLWLVPFQALRTPRGTYLIEERSVSYAPSVSALHALTARGAARPAERRLVALGDPIAGDEGAVGAPRRLPEAAREVRALGEIYGADRSTVLTDRAATEPRLRELAPHASVLHVATHGVLDDKSPMYSYLALAAGEGGTDMAADGRLEAWEVMGMDLRADLAVLSACQTARGEIGDGEGVIGLTWSLFAAGATTAAVSLWEVDSSSTTDLMIAFHRQVAQGVAVSKAMREAALGHIRTEQYRHPFYWAAFSIIGAP